MSANRGNEKKEDVRIWDENKKEWRQGSESEPDLSVSKQLALLEEEWSNLRLNQKGEWEWRGPKLGIYTISMGQASSSVLNRARMLFDSLNKLVEHLEKDKKNEAAKLYIDLADKIIFVLQNPKNKVDLDVARSALKEATEALDQAGRLGISQESLNEKRKKIEELVKSDEEFNALIEQHPKTRRGGVGKKSF